MVKRANKEIWMQRISVYRNSGDSVKAWCKKNNINVNTLKYWICKINKDKIAVKPKTLEEHSNWVKVNTCEGKSKVNEASLIVTIGKIHIQVNSGFDPELLKNIVKALSEIC